LKVSTLSQTSPTFPESKIFLDRESGKKFVIHSLPFDRTLSDSPLFNTNDLNSKNLAVQGSSFDVTISGSSLSISTSLNRFSQDSLIALLKCLLHLQVLPDAALEEVVEELKSIADFYSQHTPQASLSPVVFNTIKGKIKHSQVRQPIVLE
jgi:hypothetical protein